MRFAWKFLNARVPRVYMSYHVNIRDTAQLSAVLYLFRFQQTKQK